MRRIKVELSYYRRLLIGGVYFSGERPQSPIPLAFGTEGAQAASVPKVPKARDWVNWPVRIFVFSGFRIRGIFLLKHFSFWGRMAITLSGK
jgi:hypothetical protein